MFDLRQATATVRNLNLRAEKHGDDDLPAADLKIDTKQPNGILSEFGSQLRDAFYWRAPTAEGDQVGLDGVDEVSDRPNLRCPEVAGPFDLTYEGAGYTIVIDHGLGGKKSDIEIDDCKVNHLKFEPHEGGTVTLTMRIQFAIDEKLSGKLAMLLGREIKIDVISPSEAERLAARAAPLTPIEV